MKDYTSPKHEGLLQVPHAASFTHILTHNSDWFMLLVFKISLFCFYFGAGGYDGRTNQERWTFPSALMFSLSVFTMIGFGHLVPRTQWGKIATMLYAVVGIPVYVLYFMNMGQVLASCFKWFYCKLVTCAVDARNKEAGNSVKGAVSSGGTAPAPSAASNTANQHHKASDQMLTSAAALVDDGIDSGLIIVPSTACLWVWLTYLATGTIMFAEWEGWDYLDACYFCVTSLCKIGMGDFVPGANALAAGNQTKLVHYLLTTILCTFVLFTSKFLLKDFIE